MSAQPKPILGLILAGGLGRRMEGIAKAFARLGGVALIERVISRARPQCDALAINPHEATPEARAAYAGFGLPLLADAVPGHAGPLAGVLAGLDDAAERGFSHLLSLPCDSPFLPRDLAARLAEAARMTKDGLACAASGGRSHHVVALWPTRLRDDLRRALTVEGLRKVGQFQQRYDVATVEWAFRARDPFFNINTPDDLLQAAFLASDGDEGWLGANATPSECEGLFNRDLSRLKKRKEKMRKLDLRGLKCPLPVLKTRKLLATLAPGDRVEVACTDPLSVIDLPHMLRETGDTLEGRAEADGVLWFTIRKGADS
jgi:molybdopterin-guanine dinucleotide biosynthesis protein A